MVGMSADLACEPRRGIAGDGTYRPADSIVLGVLFAFTVVDGASDHGAIDIGSQETHDHFLANAGAQSGRPSWRQQRWC